MKIEDATPDAVYRVALRMRALDLAEFSACLPVDDREGVAVMLAERYGKLTGTMVFDGVAIGGGYEFRPNTLSLLFFATDAFPSIAYGLTRWMSRTYIPAMEAAGIHRIEATSSMGYAEMHRWLGMQGFRKEGEHPNFGKRGETFATFAWVADARPAHH